jgi:ABC-type glutathione transport system ATPase component
VNDTEIDKDARARRDKQQTQPSQQAVCGLLQRWTGLSIVKEQQPCSQQRHAKHGTGQPQVQDVLQPLTHKLGKQQNEKRAKDRHRGRLQRSRPPEKADAGDSIRPMLHETSSLLIAEGLSKSYGTSRVVDGVSLHIARGSILGLVGESGSGKSTVARMILRLVDPTAGSVLFDGIDLLRAGRREMKLLRRRMGVVFQDPFAALDGRMRVRDILAEPFLIHNEGARGRLLEPKLIAMLAEVGLDAAALGRYPHAFSGGQRQRINIARALALQPEFLVLDEPVSALDVSVGAQVINLLRDLQRTRQLTCLFISHSMPLVRYLCDRVVVMQHGRVVEEGDALQLCERPRETYTQALIAATPDLSAATG